MSRSKDIGTHWESEVVACLKRFVRHPPTPLLPDPRRWPHVERRALQGSVDKGDISGIPGVMIECKAEKRINLAGYAKEVEDQTRNASADIGVAWVKRPRKARAEDGYVVMSGSMFMKMLAEAGH